MSTPADPYAHIDPARIEAALARIEELAAMNPQALTDDELAGLRELLEFKGPMLERLRYERARRLLRKHWGGIINQYRGFVVSLAALLTFALALRDDIKEVIEWLFPS